MGAALAVFAVSLVSFIGALGLFLSHKILRRIVFILVSLSAGALFGDAFIHILPEVLESGSVTLATVSLFGILFFFLLEKFLHWRHSHGVNEEGLDEVALHDHSRKNLGPLVFFADGAHNLVDGAIIGASFAVSQELGLATTLAVILHEIPQEIGDFGLLLHAGWSKTKALLFNFISAVFAFLGLFIFYLVGDSIDNFANIALAFAAGSFLYIAGSDLLPEMHRTREIKKSAIQLVAMIFGAGLMYILLFIE